MTALRVVSENLSHAEAAPGVTAHCTPAAGRRRVSHCLSQAPSAIGNSHNNCASAGSGPGSGTSSGARSGAGLVYCAEPSAAFGMSGRSKNVDREFFSVLIRCRAHY
ncbi:hypothetical protein CLOM_g14295 [Closterium sp. NIES-68]|nr:hypothetical protein CLOM_g14295 [Closterium sp. NIES-68]GJP61724.1 hypothetical protein CLOP_g18865 [Closterium sp. NIES-67]